MFRLRQRFVYLRRYALGVAKGGVFPLADLKSPFFIGAIGMIFGRFNFWKHENHSLGDLYGFIIN